MRTWCVIAIGLILNVWASATLAAPIEAVRGKEYHLSERHGPWMIMVASFRNVPEHRREEGLSAEEAALELVYELRKNGVPAYTHAQGAIIEKIDTVDRLGREEERIYAAQRDMVCVIAGNYPSIRDDTAQKTLKWIKAFRPQFMMSEDSGAIFRETPGRRGPLAGAFMTINPLLSPEQVVQQQASNEMAANLIRWNNSSRFPLMECEKSYSLQVATFTGRQTTPIGNSKYTGKEDIFDRELSDINKYGLNRAGEEAEQLAAALRARGVEAYSHHDQYQSIVTVGSFDTPNDPAIKLIHQQYAPKYKSVPSANPADPPAPEQFTPETLIVENPKNPKGLPQAVWVFDLSPQLIPVPRVR